MKYFTLFAFSSSLGFLHVAATPRAVKNLLSRQLQGFDPSTIPAACQSVCAPAIQDLQSCGTTLACLCGHLDDLAPCFACSISGSPASPDIISQAKQQAQQTCNLSGGSSVASGSSVVINTSSGAIGTTSTSVSSVLVSQTANSTAASGSPTTPVGGSPSGASSTANGSGAGSTTPTAGIPNNTTGSPQPKNSALSGRSVGQWNLVVVIAMLVMPVFIWKI